MLPLLRDAWDNGIVTVVSAGNRPEYRFGDRSPQRYGRDDNPLITVASVDHRGSRSRFNTRPGPSDELEDIRLVGSLTVVAMGQEVWSAIAGGDHQTRMYSTGTSFATPQVAGLSAYFQSLPGSTTLSSMEMKEKIESLSRWHDAVDTPGLIYNGVRELALACESPTTRRSRRRAKKESSVHEEMEAKIAQRALIRPILIPPKKKDPPAQNPAPSPGPEPPQSEPPKLPSLPPKVPSFHHCKRAKIVRQ